MTRRTRVFALVLGLLAAAVSSNGMSAGASAPATSSSQRTSAELQSAIVATETMPAHIVGSERRDDSSDRGIKLSRLVLLAVLAALALLTVRRSRSGDTSEGEPWPSVVRARHLGRSPPALVTV
jgi:hypothetical protein